MAGIRKLVVPCSEFSCKRMALCKGLCKMHYDRERKRIASSIHLAGLLVKAVS